MKDVTACRLVRRVRCAASIHAYALGTSAVFSKPKYSSPHANSIIPFAAVLMADHWSKRSS